MSPVGYEPIVSAGERPQTYALDRAATGTGTAEGIEFLNVQEIGLQKHLTSKWQKIIQFDSSFCNH